MYTLLLYAVTVSYTHLDVYKRQGLDIERGEKSDLHCEIEIDEYFDNTVINDNNLPDVDQKY